MRAFAVTLCAVLLGFSVGLPLASAGERAPEFKLLDLEGKTISLSAMCAKGPVLVSFWATWCVPCREELKHLELFQKKYAADSLTILAISIDGTKTVSQVKPFVLGRRMTMPVLLDTNNDVKRLYRVSPVPTLCLVRRDGTVAYTHTGYRPGDEAALEQEIRKVIAADSGKCGGAGAPSGASGDAGAEQKNE